MKGFFLLAQGLPGGLAAGGSLDLERIGLTVLAWTTGDKSQIVLEWDGGLVAFC